MPKSKPTNKDKSTAGEWTSRVLKELRVTSTVSWRAEISTSPDGKTFAGVKKVVTKKDGSTVYTRDGVSFVYDAATIHDEVDRLITLLSALKGGTVKAPKAAETVDTSHDEVGFYLVKDNFTLVRVAAGIVYRTQDVHSGKLFRDSASAKAYRTSHGLSPAVWKVRKLAFDQ